MHGSDAFEFSVPQPSHYAAFSGQPPLAYTPHTPSAYHGPFEDIHLGLPVPFVQPYYSDHPPRSTPPPADTAPLTRTLPSSSTSIPSLTSVVNGRTHSDNDVENYEWDDSLGLWHVRCPDCGLFINTGNSRTKKLGCLDIHRGKKECRKRAEEARNSTQRAHIRQARQVREALFPPPSSASETTPWGSFLAGHRARNHTPPPAEAHAYDFEVLTPRRYAATEYHDEPTASDGESEGSPPNSTAQLHDPFEPCQGVPLEWPKDRFFQSYPFQRHGFDAPSLGYHFCSVESRGTEFWVRADGCTRVRSKQADACPECIEIRDKVAHLAAMAQHARPHTRHSYLTHEQLRDLLRVRETQLDQWKLKGLSLMRKCSTTLRKLDDHKRFIMAVATADIPRLDQLVRRGLKEKVAVGSIVGRIEEALAGVYKARGYGSDDHDIALLVLRLGGRKLLHSLSKHITLPTIRTLRRARSVVKLMPSLGVPTADDVVHNMKQIFTPASESVLGLLRPFRSGITVMMDEVSLEERSCYFPHADCAGGFCREHSSSVNTRLSSFENAVNMARRLFEGKLHLGKEASVVAIGSFGTTLRGAFPVLISPTCKAETPSGTASLLSKVFAAWKGTAAAHFGPIWSFASDGDAGRRAMVYQEFMKNKVDESHELFRFLGNLPGLNRFTGEDDVTADFDWKHELKRIGRLFRTLEGVMVGKTVLNHELFKKHLRRGDRTELEVSQLMNPADSQDVPRAIEFIEAIEEISRLPTDGCDPGELQEVRLISVVGEVFTSFMDAFISPDWSLTQQLTSLSKFAHAAFALFHQEGVNFMPNQLYGDMQTTVKNAFFCVAKQQLLDDSQPFYLFWLGDDRLETLFGRVRMQCGHNPNFTLKQLVDRLGAAMDIQAVYNRHPNLDPGFRRLKITRTEHLDHLNPDSWRGCATASSVCLESAWLAGREQATALLSKISMTVDFNALFGPTNARDLFCQRDDGSYPGVAHDSDDRSLEPEELERLRTPLGATTEVPQAVYIPLASLHIPQTAADSSACPSDVYSMSEDEIHELSSTSHNDNTSDLDPTNGTENDTDASGLEFEDALEEGSEDDLALPRAANLTSVVDHWLEYQGRKIHKASICRLVITMDYTRKSHERVLRVRGYTMDWKHHQILSSSDLLSGDNYMVGDLFTTLLRCDNEACLAVLKTIAIEQGTTRVERVLAQNIAHPSSRIRFLAQVLALRPLAESSQATDLPSDHQADTWLWDGTFLQLALAGKTPMPSATSKGVRRSLVIRVPSHICEPVNPKIVDVKTRYPSESWPDLNSSGVTWELTDAELSLFTSVVWDKIKSHNALSSLPAFRINNMFPYRNASSTHAFVCQEASEQLAAAQEQADGKFRCLQCLLVMDRRAARNHVGHHILRSLREVPETLPGIPVGKTMPCGFCGRSGISSCQQLYLTTGKNPQAKSECSYAHIFQYKPSLQSKPGGMVCTNTPILCTIPGCTRRTGNYLSAVWKYNMEEHIRQEHPGYSCDGFQPGTINPELLTAMHITREEEEAMKIPESHIPRLKYVDYIRARQGGTVAPTPSSTISASGGTPPVLASGPATPIRSANKRLLDNELTSSLKRARARRQ